MAKWPWVSSGPIWDRLCVDDRRVWCHLAALARARAHRKVDAERLKLLARPREPPPPPEPPAPPPREARRLAQRSSSEPMLCRTPALPPLVEKATGVNGGIGGATGAVLRPPPKRATKLRHSADVTLPGLSDLLRSAETAALAVGRGGLSVVDAESDEDPRARLSGGGD